VWRESHVEREAPRPSTVIGYPLSSFTNIIASLQLSHKQHAEVGVYWY